MTYLSALRLVEWYFARLRRRREIARLVAIRNASREVC